MVTVTDEAVKFFFYRPDAREVSLAGEFNDWHTDQLPMTHDGRGNWSLAVEMPSGEFRFRYCADGEWFTDYAAFGLEPGQFGLDSIVRVPHKPLQMPVTTAGRKGIAA